MLSGPLKAIRQAGDLGLRIVITGQHLSDSAEGSRQSIVEDGFAIDGKIDPGLSGDSPRAIAEATGRITTSAAGIFEEFNPDSALVLGDRFEIFAIATAAALMEVPVAHIHGGEATHGAVDDSLRNAITKLSSLHFASAAPYRDRIIQMGEAPDRVFDVGAPGVELLMKTPREDISRVWQLLGRKLPDPFILVTYHPETAGKPQPGRDINEVLIALEASAAAGILFTGVNADARHSEVDTAIQTFVSANSTRAAFVDNMGQRLYWTAMANCAAVVGNSSSGVIEAPSLAIPTVNVGTRQAGRLRAASVIDSPPNRDEIKRALNRAIARNLTLDGRSPYSGDNTSARIADVLANTDFDELLPKPFHDIAGMNTA